MGGLLDSLVRGLGARPRPSLGEALVEAVERSVAGASGWGSRAAGRLEELERRLTAAGLLRPLEPLEPGGPVYGVDGGMARARWGPRLVAVLHAVAVPLSAGAEPLHLAAVVSVEAGGPEAEAAVETAMIALETAVAAEALARSPGALLVLDGPLADPPWEPEPGPALEEAAAQLMPGRPPEEAAEVLARIHEARAEAFAGGRVVGVVKRLTGRLLDPVLGDEGAARGLAALLRGRGAPGPHAVGPLRLTGGVYERYAALGGLETVYVLLPGGPRAYRVEAPAGRGLEAAGAALGLTLPGPWLPEPVVAAHRAARVPPGALRLLRMALAAEAAGDPVREALLLP